jgi:(p)ppGpp synthase/HD superfamily hydrolase
MGSLLDKAIRKAAKLHAGQEREGEHPLPYITHPVEVLLNLRHVGGVTDENWLCVAALHDVIEECGTSPDWIEERFGRAVREGVEELTRHEPSEKETAGLSAEEIWRLRAEMLLEEIRQMSPDAQRVKLADRLSNLHDALRTKREEKLDRYMGHSRQILEIVPRHVNPELWDAVDALLKAHGR